MKLYVKCARCGGDLEVEPQMIANAEALGQNLVLEHAPGECPHEGGVPAAPAPLRRFRAQVFVVELPNGEDAELFDSVDLDWATPTLTRTEDGAELPQELIAGIGHTVEAKNAGEAVAGPLTGWLNDAWPRLQETAAFADLPVGQTAPPEPERTEQAIPVEVVSAAPSRLIVPGR